MSEIDPEERAQWIKTRRMEIHAALAESKRAYICEGAGMTLAERVTIEAEDAKLALEARQIGAIAEAAKVIRRQRENASLLAHLLEVLKERGLGDVVTEAQMRSAAAISV